MWFWVFNLILIDDTLEGEDYIISSHFSTIVEFHPLIYFKIKRWLIDPFYGFGQL